MEFGLERTTATMLRRENRSQVSKMRTQKSPTMTRTAHMQHHLSLRLGGVPQTTTYRWQATSLIPARCLQRQERRPSTRAMGPLPLRHEVRPGEQPQPPHRHNFAHRCKATPWQPTPAQEWLPRGLWEPERRQAKQRQKKTKKCLPPQACKKRRPTKTRLRRLQRKELRCRPGHSLGTKKARRSKAKSGWRPTAARQASED
mmetsp:Transcript_101851/g.176757  ORF Transcript_101851/g.176757 Transcript_101851/m.176757 type:complete len:201 (-) Transcript_101851:422-1024(-)